MKYTTNKKFWCKDAAIVALQAWERMFIYTGYTVSTWIHAECGIMKLTVQTEGRRVPEIPENYTCSRRTIYLHKREDGTNFTCFTYHFDFE